MKRSVALVALLTSGCFDIAIPERAQIQCASTEECPPEFVCRSAIQLCVPARSADSEAPIVANSAIDPLLAGVGREITIDFETNEPLLLPPSVSIDVGGVARALAITVVDADTKFQATYTAIGDEGEGAHDVRASLVDAFGNITPDADLGAITFDFTGPAIADVVVTPPVAKDGDSVTLALRTSEPLDDAQSAAVIVDGRALALSPVGDDPLVRTFTLLASRADDGEGLASLSITAADVAGNKATRAVPDALRFDFTAPTIEGAPIVPRPIVAAGQVALLSFRTSEAVSDVVVELVPEAGGDPLPMALETNEGRDVSFRREIAAGDADGVYIPRVVALVDEAGIAAAAQIDLLDAPIIIDQRSPSFVVAPTSSPAVASRVSGRDLVRIEFAVDEPATAIVRLGDDEVPCTSSGAPTVAFICERGTNDNDVEGVRGVTVTVVDAADNSAFATAPSVAVDFTAPALVLGVVPDRQARAGEVIAVSAVANETLDPNTIVFDNGGLAFSAPSVSGNAVTTFFTVPPGTEGAFTVSFAAADLGGNASSPETRQVLIDGVAPSLASFALSSPRIAPLEEFTLAVTPSEALADAPVGTFANGDVVNGVPVVHTMTATGPDAQGAFVLRGVGPETGQNQFYTITVVMQDLAGNSGADNPAVIVVDNTPPELAGFDIAPAFARDGDSVRVVVTANETLAAPPVIVARNGAASFTLSPGSNAPGAISYVFTFPVNASTVQGTWTFDAFTLVDEANNSGVIAADPSRRFDVDSRAPTLSNVSLSPNVARAGTTVTLTASVDEAVSTANATIDGVPMTLTTTLPAQSLSFRYVATGDEPEGVLGVTVSVADGAGNVGIAGADVEMDFTPPRVVASSVTPTAARAGSVVTYTLSADEELQSEPTLTVGGGAIPFAFQNGTAFVYTYTVAQNDPSGARTVTAQLTDLAGNSASIATTGFSIDTVVPVISNFNVTPTHASLVAGFNVVTTTFTLSEAVGAGLSVTIGGRAATCTNAGLDFTCTQNVLAGDTAGTKTVIVQATDAAGNIAQATGSVELDFTAPSLLSSSVTPSTATRGAVISYNISASEPLLNNAAPALTVNGPSATAFTAVANTQFTYTYRVTGAETSGARTVSLTLTDRAGNARAVSGVGFAIDVNDPVISSFTLGATKLSTQSGFNSTTIRTTVTDLPAGSAPTVVVRAGAATIPCTPSGAELLCPYSATGAEPSALSFTVTATDAAGNTITDARTLEFDFAAPTVVGPVSLAIVPASTEPLANPTAARLNTLVRVGFSLSERVASTTVRTTGSPALDFAAEIDTNPTFLFTHQVTGSPPQGAQTVQLVAVDDVGNTLTTNLALPAPGFVIDTVAPAQPDVQTQDRTVFERAPWGDSSGTRRLRVVGAAGAVEANATVIGFSTQNASAAVELGRTTAAANGSYTLNLNGADLARVFLTAVDAAGNSSDAVGATAGIQATGIRDVSWTASMGFKVPGSTFENPHRFESRAQLVLTRAQKDAIEPTDVSALASVNGVSTQTTGLVGWQRVEGEIAFPGRSSIVFDKDEQVLWTRAGDTGIMRFDGFRWESVTPLDPEGDGNAPSSGDYQLAFDENQREVVMFSQNGETWIWNGTSWRLGAGADDNGVNAPRPRFSFGMVWDDNRAAIMLFGGSDDTVAQATCEDDGACLNDLWEWDGFGWNDMSSVGAPSPRTGAAVGYDKDFGALIVFGGRSDLGTFNDTFFWDGAWGQLQTSPITARANARMIHDPFLGGLIMIGGEDVNFSPLSNQDFFDGSDWSPSPTQDPELDGNPPARGSFGLAYDSNRDRYWLFGGEGNCGACNDTWQGTANSWRRVGATEDIDALPSGRNFPGVSFERTRGTIVMFGGQQANLTMLNELRVWDGAAWPLRAQSGTLPIARRSVAMAFDESQGRTIMFGGRAGNSATVCDSGAGTGTCDGTYILNTINGAGAWTQLLPATRPSKRHSAAAAYNSSSQLMVLFGGFTGFGDFNANGETWEWDTTGATTGAWVQRCLAGACGAGTPSARGGAAMAYDRTRNRIMLFGGLGADSDVYEYTIGGGTTRTWTRIPVQDPETDGSPVARPHGRLVYDEQRQKMYFFGEPDLLNPPCDVQPRPVGCGDAWEWNALTSSWRRITATAGPSGDFRPTPRVGHNWVFDPQRGETILVGGSTPFETWRFTGGGNQRPGHAVHIDFRTAAAGGAPVRDVTISWSVGATSTPAGTAVNGAQILALRDGVPVFLTSNVASAAAPQTVTSTVSTANFNLFNPDQVMTFFAQPLQTSGTGATRGVVRSDHVQATVRYRLF